MNKSKIRVIVVDDHPVVREGLISMLEATDQIEVVGQAGNAAETIRKVKALRPEVVLLDIRLPGKSGLEACHALSRQCPECRVIMLTSFEEEDHLFKALQVGAWGYLAKTASHEEIVAAITAVAGGERLLSAPMVDKLVTRFDQVVRRMEQLGSGFDPEEMNILKMLASGATNKDISRSSHWSEVSVKRKLQIVFDKLGVNDRTSAVMEAMRRGLL